VRPEMWHSVVGEQLLAFQRIVSDYLKTVKINSVNNFNNMYIRQIDKIDTFVTQSL